MNALATSKPASPEAERFGLAVWVATIGLGTVVTVMATTVVNTALPSIGDDLQAPLGTVEWISTSYLLALTAALPASAWATDRFGERRVWQAGLMTFVVGSMACALAPGIGELIAARIVQGIGGGVLLPVGQTVLVRRAPAFRLTGVLAMLAVLNLSGPALGPLLGGAIVDHVSWRWVFAAAAPLGLLAMVLAAVVLPAARARHRQSLDIVGALLLTPAVVLVVLGLSHAVRAASLSADAAAALAAGIALTAAYVIHARRRGPRSLVDIEALRAPGFGAAALLALTFGVLLFGMLLVLPLWFQATRDASAVAAGAAVVPQAIGSLLTLIALGLRRGSVPLRIVPIGLGLTTVGTLPLLVAQAPAEWIAVGLVLRGMGLSAVLTPAMAAAYRAVGETAAPLASTAMNLCLRIGGALGTAVFTALLQRRLDGPFGDIGVANQLAELRHGVAPQMVHGVDQAFMGVFAAMAVVAALAVVPALRLNRAAAQ